MSEDRVPFFYPEFPVDMVPQAPVPPPTFRRVPPPLIVIATPCYVLRWNNCGLIILPVIVNQ